MTSRRTAAALALSLLAPAAFAQTPTQPVTPDAVPPRRIELAAPVEVPLALEANLPILEARVNGQGPFRFGIETGAGFVVISPELAAKLALKRTGGPDDSPEYHVDRLDIGAAAFHDFPVSALRVAQPGIDGVLGLPLYRDLLLTIDYPNSRARFERGSLPAADGQTVLALSHIGPFWGLPIVVAGAPQAAVLRHAIHRRVRVHARERRAAEVRRRAARDRPRPRRGDPGDRGEGGTAGRDRHDRPV